MSEESALDAIFEIRDILISQQQEIKLLQVSLNTIGSKVNKTLYPDFTGPKGLSVDIPVPEKDLSHLYQPGEVTPVSVPQPAPVAPPRAAPKQNKNIRVFGHFNDENNKPFAGVMVRITDANNNIVKQTKSNRAGLWMSFLPPGNYVAEFIMAGMQPEARQFQLFNGQKEVEII